jgi:hypothetical protein
MPYCPPPLPKGPTRMRSIASLPPSTA